MHLDDTIAAIASAPGGALRGIVRLSGPRSVACASAVFEPTERQDLGQIHVTSCLPGEARLPRLGNVPATLYLWPTERSYTRQPSAELHLFGSPPLIEAALEAVCEAGARLAGPGEFTLRAFLAGRLDLTQAEAVLGVIDAGGQAELDVALSQLAGGVAQPLHRVREELLDLLAHLEAGLDFVEEDIEFIAPQQLETQLAAAAERVSQIAARMQSRGRSEELPRVVLVGSPNAGKSSLLNALAADETAIVSDIAGTTRDYVSRRVAVAGETEFLLIDTAGSEDSVDDDPEDPIAAAAQSASRRQIERAELVLLCLDASQTRGRSKGAEVFGGVGSSNLANRFLPETLDPIEPPPIQPAPFEPAPFEPASFEPALPCVASNPRGSSVTEAARTRPAEQIVVWTKCDLLSPAEAERPSLPGLKTSSRTGEGIDTLQQTIAVALASRLAEPVVAGTADRCRESLRLASQALERARHAAAANLGEELVAAEVRLALDQLGQVVGTVYTDDILDRVFSRFCIGK